MIRPAVDPISEEEGAQGTVLAQVFAVKTHGVDAFAQKAKETFAGYRAAGVREGGVLMTLDMLNTFPPLPFRTDGPHLVWLGIVGDDHALETRFRPLAERSLQSLAATGLLRAAPELIVLQPAGLSRWRWFPEWQE